MKRILLSATAKLGLFSLAIGFGMVSYLVVQQLGAETEAGEMGSERGKPDLVRHDLVLGAEAFLLARTESPVDLAGDLLGIFYILQKNGDVIRVTPEVGGGTSASRYAELADAKTDESLGHSGITIHPDFLDKERPGYGRFYIITSEKAGTGSVDFAPEFGGGSEHHQDVLYEYAVEDPFLPAFRGEKRELMRFSQPGAENNLRGLAFDTAGHLYVGVGDGAAAEVGRRSPSRNASSLTCAFGKVLRIDPTGGNSANGSYGIPDGNPFRLVTGTLPELWVFGLRAPHSLSFDPFQRSLCIGESGGNGNEAINLSLYGGEHFGWDLSEGSAKLSRAERAQLAGIVTPPVFAFDPSSGFAARTTGSVVYRGESFPSLAGRIIFASGDGQLLATGHDSASDSPRSVSRLGVGRLEGQRFTALRSGPRGELLVLCEDGQVFEMRKGVSVGTGNSGQRSLFCENAGAGDATFFSEI